MFCSNCGAEITNEDAFCPMCGKAVDVQNGNYSSNPTSLNGGTSLSSATSKLNQKLQAQDENSMPQFMDSSKYSDVFIESDEQLLSTLGNGYLVSLLGKRVKKCHALLTDKRVYLQGTFFSGSSKSLEAEIAEKIVDLDDITGTGFRYFKPFSILKLLILLLLPVLIYFFDCLYRSYDPFGCEWMEAVISFYIMFIPIYLISFVVYLTKRKTYFIIEYSGGSIRISASIVDLNTVKEFHKQLRLAKEQRKKKN